MLNNKDNLSDVLSYEMNNNLKLNNFLYRNQDIQEILPFYEMIRRNIIIFDNKNCKLNENKIDNFLNKIKASINNMSLNDMYNNDIIKFDNDKTFIFSNKKVKDKKDSVEDNTYEYEEIII